MDVSQFMGSYLKAVEVKQTVVCVIRDCMSEVVGGDTKPVLYFQGHTKGLVLNATNLNKMAELYGVETSNWAGRSVELRREQTTFQGKPVDCIRVHAPSGAALVPAPESPGPPPTPPSPPENGPPW